MEHEDLLIRFDVEEQRMRTLVSDVLEVNPESIIPGLAGSDGSWGTSRTGNIGPGGNGQLPDPG